MAIAVLSQASSFNTGADLWILPDLDSCKLTLKVDWYLHFQITQAERRTPPFISEFLLKTLEETELPALQIPLDPKAPLLINSQNSLPARWVLVIPYQKLSTWVETAHQVWQGLNQPSLRIFLPTGQSAGSFQEIWQTYSKYEDFSLVLD